jgi:hypothetical protein
MAVKEDKKDFVWKAVRLSFYAFIALFVVAIVTAIFAFEFESDVSLVIYLVAFWLIFLVLIFNFITSIIHLTKHKEKGFAITSLVISSLFVFIMLISFLIGALSPTSEYENDIEEYVDFSCQNFCTGIENVDSYYYEYDEISDEVICYCLDPDEEIITQKPILLE